jgi:ABC-type phosphate transport system ATPase subunit
MTIVIAAHNLKKAARISDHSEFLYLDKLVEYDETKKFTKYKHKFRKSCLVSS